MAGVAKIEFGGNCNPENVLDRFDVSNTGDSDSKKKVGYLCPGKSWEMERRNGESAQINEINQKQIDVRLTLKRVGNDFIK